MPYNSHFSIETIPQDYNIIEELIDTYDLHTIVSTTGDSLSESSWFEMPEQMIEFSKRYSSQTFIVTRTGEDLDDHYKIYFKDGQHQVCKGRVVYDEPKPFETKT